jgi:hypothetical protein
LRFAADENFNGNILRAILQYLPALDILRIQDTAVAEGSDPAILEWAAREGRIILTHDVRTLPGFAFERVRAGQPMAGVIEVDDDARMGDILEDIVLLVEASTHTEWEDQVIYIPFPRGT